MSAEIRVHFASDTDVQLWTVDPGALEETDALSALLEPYEHAARARLVDPSVAHEYFVTRVLARVALGTFLGEAPQNLRFTRTPHGRPELAPSSEVRFNLSNTKGLVVCLIAKGREVGVDVEARHRGETILDLSETVFAKREQEALAALPNAARPDHATQLWTLKESYLKARGKGLSMPLDAFAFRIGTVIDVDLEPVLEDEATRWSFQTFQIGTHVVSCCIERDRIGTSWRAEAPKVTHRVYGLAQIDGVEHGTVQGT